MKKIWILPIFLLICFNSKAELSSKEYLDSIKTLHYKGDHRLLIPLYEPALKAAKNENAIEIGEDLLALYINSKTVLGFYDKVDSIFLNRHGYFNQSLAICQQGKIFDSYGYSKFIKGEMVKSIYFLLKADSIFTHCHKEQAGPKIKLGLLYASIGKNYVSTKYFIQAYNLSKANQNKFNVIMALSKIIEQNKDSLDFEPYFTYFQKFIASKPDLSTTGHEVLLFQGKNKITLSTMERLYKKRYDDFFSQSNYPFYYYYMVSLEDEKQYEKAIEIGEEILPQIQNLNRFISIKNCLLFLSELYLQINKPQKAFDYYKNAIELRDSLTSIKVKQNIDSLHLKYKTALKDNQISNQQLQLKVRTRQRNLYLGIGLAVALLGLLIIWALNLRNKKNIEIAEKDKKIYQNEIEKMEHEHKLLALDAMISGQEKERIRIAQDLHDGLGSLLSSVKMQFEAVQKEIEKLAEINVYQEAGKLIDNACVEVRKIAHNMMPASLVKLGLIPAVQDLAASINLGGKVLITVEVINWADKLEETKEIVLYRIVQELVNNALKHASGTQIIIQFSYQNEKLELLVEDNGKGFNLENLNQKDGIGLNGVKNRVSYLKGEINIESQPNEGTTITISIPIND